MTLLKPLKRGITTIARKTLAPMPLEVWQRAFPKNIIGLCYHMVSDEDLPHFQMFPYKTIAQFRADVDFAKPRAIRYSDLLANRLEGKPIPRNSFFFTFDDGFSHCYSVIRPILLEQEVDAAFFVTTDFTDDRVLFRESKLSLCITAARSMNDDAIAGVMAHLPGTLAPPSSGTAARPWLLEWLADDRRRSTVDIDEICSLLHVDVSAYVKDTSVFMSREQIIGLVEDGFTVGAHGLSHRRLEYLEPADIEAEMVASCEAIRAITGRKRVPFAFPHSGIAIDRNLIARIMRRNPFIELVFDSGNLRRDASFVVNRIFNDAPTSSCESNIPAAMQSAWTSPSAWFRESALRAK